MGFSTEPIEHIDWFERYENSPCLNHQLINSDRLEGAIRNPILQEEVVGRALSGSVCSLPFASPSVQGGIELFLKIKSQILVLKYIFYPQKIGVHNFLRRSNEGFKGDLETR